MKASKATTVDQFVAEAPAEARPVLEQIRTIVKQAVPADLLTRLARQQAKRNEAKSA